MAKRLNVRSKPGDDPCRMLNDKPPIVLHLGAKLRAAGYGLCPPEAAPSAGDFQWKSFLYDDPSDPTGLRLILKRVSGPASCPSPLQQTTCCKPSCTTDRASPGLRDSPVMQTEKDTRPKNKRKKVKDIPPGGTASCSSSYKKAAGKKDTASCSSYKSPVMQTENKPCTPNWDHRIHKFVNPDAQTKKHRKQMEDISPHGTASCSSYKKAADGKDAASRSSSYKKAARDKKSASCRSSHKRAAGKKDTASCSSYKSPVMKTENKTCTPNWDHWIRPFVDPDALPTNKRTEKKDITPCDKTSFGSSSYKRKAGELDDKGFGNPSKRFFSDSSSSSYDSDELNRQTMELINLINN